MLVMFYKVFENSELVNIEVLFLGELASFQKLFIYFDQYMAFGFFHVCSCVKIPYLIYNVDSLC